MHAGGAQGQARPRRQRRRQPRQWSLLGAFLSRVSATTLINASLFRSCMHASIHCCSGSAVYTSWLWIAASCRMTTELVLSICAGQQPRRGEPIHQRLPGQRARDTLPRPARPVPARPRLTARIENHFCGLPLCCPLLLSCSFPHYLGSQRTVNVTPSHRCVLLERNRAVAGALAIADLQHQ